MNIYIATIGRERKSRKHRRQEMIASCVNQNVTNSSMEANSASKRLAADQVAKVDVVCMILGNNVKAEKYTISCEYSDLLVTSKKDRRSSIEPHT